MVQRSAKDVAGPEAGLRLSTWISRHPPAEQIETKLPDITEFARTYLGVD